MRLGICAPPEKAGIVKKAGFDFYEFQLVKVDEAPEDVFEGWLRLQEDAGIRCEAFNVMLPPRFNVTGPGVDLPSIRAYLEKAIDRAARMGCETIVFGSAGARNMPEGFSDKQRAFEQLVEYLHMASDICAKHGVVIAIEPLGAPYTNIVTFVAEGNYLCHLANRANVRLLTDLFAMKCNEESFEELIGYAPRLHHLHFCAYDRKYPRRDDGCDYGAYFDAVIRAGYNGRMSVEAIHNGDELEDMKEAMEVFKAYL